MFSLQDVADLLQVTRDTVKVWQRAGQLQVVIRRRARFKVEELVTPDEVMKLFHLKHATPGDGSPTDLVYQERNRRRAKGGLAGALARWSKLKAQQAAAAARDPSPMTCTHSLPPDMSCDMSDCPCPCPLCLKLA